MIAMMRERLNKEEGFTLVELMVVVLIIAILIAIAIPTFLGARERAQDRAAQSNLRNALTAQKVYYTDSEEYADAANLQAANIEPSLTFAVDPLDTDNGVIGVLLCPGAVANQAMAVNSISATGTTWAIYDVSTGDFPGTYYSNVLVDTCIGATTDPGATLSEDGFPAAP